MSSVATWTSGTFESCDSLRNTSNACRSQWDAKVDFSNKPKRVKASSPALIGVHAQERFVTKVVRCTKDSHLQLVSDASGRYIVKVAQEVVFESRFWPPPRSTMPRKSTSTERSTVVSLPENERTSTCKPFAQMHPLARPLTRTKKAARAVCNPFRNQPDKARLPDAERDTRTGANAPATRVPPRCRWSRRRGWWRDTSGSCLALLAYRRP